MSRPPRGPVGVAQRTIDEWLRNRDPPGMPAFKVRPGQNVWRIMVTARSGRSERQMRAHVGPIVARLLYPANRSLLLYRYPRGRTSYVWGCGKARPIEVIELKRGGEAAAMAVPNGEIQARCRMVGNQISCRSNVIGGVPPSDGSVWWVYVQFWWRGAEVEMPWPWFGAPDVYDSQLALATVDAAVYPQAQQPARDLSLLAALREGLEKAIEQTTVDLEKTRSWAQRQLPTVIVLGATAALAYYWWTRDD